jgi:hypothetical protein
VPAETATKTARRTEVRTFLLLFCALLASAGLHLSFPDRQEHQRSVRLSRLLDYVYNSDSSEYAILVTTFPSGFKQHPIRLLRPLYPAIGFLVYQPLRALKPLLPADFCRRAADAMAKNGGEPVWKGMDVRDVVLAWAALIIVNFGLYMASLVLIVQSLRRVFAPHLASLLAMYPALHRNAIDFILVPAADPFNVLLPAIFLYTASVIWSEKRVGLETAFALGVGILGKGILYPIGNWAYEHLAVRNWREGWRVAILCGGLFAAPMLTYLALFLVPGMPDWRQDVNIQRDRSFLWMLDYFQEGLLVEIPMRWMSSAATHLMQVVEGWAVPLCLGLLVAFRTDRKSLVVQRNLCRHLLVYSASAAVFFVLGPFLYPRLSICYYPAVVVALGVVVVRRTAKPGACLLLGLIAQAIVFALVNALM